MNLDDYVKTVGDYADQVARAEREAEQRSMEIARVMDYEYREAAGLWVPQWLEQRPEPKRPTNRWDPAARNRFLSWSAWTLDQAGRRHPARIRSWTLMEAVNVARSVPSEQILQLPTVEPVRPLFWMRKNQYADRIPEVWAIAVELAGGNPKAVTSRHTREALAQWKKQTFGTRRDGTPRKTTSAVSQAAAAAGKANQLRARAMEEVREMYRLAALNEKARDEFEGFLTDLDGFLDEHTMSQAGAA